MKKETRGFALLEVLLALVIIVVAGLGIFGLFSSADTQNKVDTTKKIILQVAGAANALSHTTYSDSIATTVTTSAIIQSGLVSSQYIVSGAIVGPYGKIYIDTNGDHTKNGRFAILAQMPVKSSAAVLLCETMLNEATVSVPQEGAPVTTQSGCSDYKTQSTFEPDYGIHFYFPKSAGLYV